MRSRKPRTGLLITVLLMLAVLQLAVGIFAIFIVKAYRDQVTPKSKVEKQIEQEEQDVFDDEDAVGQDEAADENDPESIDDPDNDQDQDEDEDDQDEEDPDDEDDDDKDKDYVMMTVQAPDNYAAVRAGRGITYEEVGRINNGRKVALTDLKNGWYKIAKGKYKGYYTHQSSYVAG